MKKTKKLASLLLALVMALALAVPAMATGETGTIILDNPKEGVTYTAYKIFDVSYSADKSSYSYTIYYEDEWYDAVENYDGLTLTPIDGAGNFFVTTNDAFSAADFADTLKADIAGKTDGVQMGDADEGGKKVKKATNLDLGYYFVYSSETDALCNLTTTNPSVTIHDKNDMPFEKEDDKDSVEIGETVTYTITGKVPDTTGFDEYSYVIKDTMSDGLTLNRNIAVTIGGTAASITPTYTEADGRTNGFSLTIPVTDYQTQVGAAIVVTYTAVVNANAAGNVENNHAVLEYKNDPSSEVKTIEREQTVYSAKIVINKVVKGTETKLPDAKFVLYKEEAGAKKYYKYTEANGTNPAKVEWVDNQTAATEVTTNDQGVAEFKGLKDGTYYLLETEAPAGYNLLTEPKEITINGASATATSLTSLTHTEQVENSTGAVLPSTGGMGTTIFYVTGSILVLAAVVLLVTKKRMKSAK